MVQGEFKIMKKLGRGGGVLYMDQGDIFYNTERGGAVGAGVLISED